MFAQLKRFFRSQLAGANQPPAAKMIAKTGEHHQAFASVTNSMTGVVQTDVGCQRAVNEDSGLFFQPEDEQTRHKKGMLMIVADGMGGHAAGEIASQLAVEIIRNVYYADPASPNIALDSAFSTANTAIRHRAKKEPELQGMGTTCTALALHNGLAYCAHIGDSRLYLVRGGQIYLMSEDHSAVMEMVRHGLLTLKAARHHEDKNIILRALGTQPKVKATIWEKPFPVQPQDRFLLCSDGLYDLVEDEEIKQAVESYEPGAACAKLISLAKERGGHDNITVGIVSLMTEPQAATYAIQPTRELQVVSCKR